MTTISWRFTKRIHCHAVTMQDNANKPCGDIKDDEGGLRGLGGFIILEPILNVG